MKIKLLITCLFISSIFNVGCVNSLGVPIPSVAPPTNPEFLTGSKLKEHCFRTSKYHSGICSGFIMGVYGVFLSEKIWATDSPSVCPPEKVKSSQLKEIAVNYLGKETENLHKDAAELVWDSFILAFPCKK